MSLQINLKCTSNNYIKIYFLNNNKTRPMRNYCLSKQAITNVFFPFAPLRSPRLMTRCRKRSINHKTFIESFLFYYTCAIDVSRRKGISLLRLPNLPGWIQLGPDVEENGLLKINILALNKYPLILFFVCACVRFVIS